MGAGAATGGGAAGMNMAPPPPTDISGVLNGRAGMAPTLAPQAPPSAWRTGLKKAGQFANAWDAAAPQQQPQQQAQPVNFNMAPMPYIPPPQMGPGFYGG